MINIKVNLYQLCMIYVIQAPRNPSISQHAFDTRALFYDGKKKKKKKKKSGSVQLSDAFWLAQKAPDVPILDALFIKLCPIKPDSQNFNWQLCNGG